MAKNNKFVAGRVTKRGVFIPMFMGDKEECFRFADKYQNPYEPIIVHCYKYVYELKPFRNMNRIKLSGE